MAIKVVVDSASDISKEEAKSMGISVIPLLINFGSEEYYDGENLSPVEFYEKLIESDVLPKTSQITPYRFEEEFNKHVQSGDEVIAITISSKLSGTYESAVTASQKFVGKVRVIDSLNACIGERLLCEYAVRLIKENKTAEEIETELNRVKSRINVMAVISTLEYLKKGGRISATTALIGSMVMIKPVVAVLDGEVKVVGKALGSKNGNNLLNKLVKEKGEIDFSMPYGVVYSGLDKSMLDKYVKDSAYLWQDFTDSVPEYILGATIGTHIGPGGVGVAFFTKEK